MERIAVAGLRAEATWHEIGYSTGDALWPLARVRVTPEDVQDERLHQPNAPPLPAAIAARLSASLVDDAGQVLQIGGRCLLGRESIHRLQFDADAALDAVGWLDSCAGLVIEELLRWARGMQAAAVAGLLPAQVLA